MISRGEAVAFCAARFPQGPETLAERLGVIVRRSDFEGDEDGWCVRAEKCIVRLNTRKSKRRQRFTLAHELSHLILGTEGDVIGSPSGAYRAETDEERQANRLASELLLPAEKVQGIGLSLPVDGPALKRIARRGRVTEVMAACRIATLAREIGLRNAAVIGFEGDEIAWRWSDTLVVPSEQDVRQLRDEALRFGGGLYRHGQADGTVVCASLLRTRDFHALFVQVLPRQFAQRRTPDERRRELEDWLFADDPHFRSSLNGQFGYFLKRMRERPMPLDDAVTEFLRSYGDKWTTARRRRMHSQQGRDWVRLKLEINLGPAN